MAKKVFTVTVNPTESQVYQIEASSRKAATNKAFRQWRDEVAKKHDNIDVERFKEGAEVHSETQGEEQVEGLA